MFAFETPKIRRLVANHLPWSLGREMKQPTQSACAKKFNLRQILSDKLGIAQ